MIRIVIFLLLKSKIIGIKRVAIILLFSITRNEVNKIKNETA